MNAVFMSADENEAVVRIVAVRSDGGCDGCIFNNDLEKCPNQLNCGKLRRKDGMAVIWQLAEEE